jgi:hypothetical protein
MGVPPTTRGSEFEHDPRNDPSPAVPKPLPDRGRRAGTAITMVLAALVVVVLIVLL